MTDFPRDLTLEDEMILLRPLREDDFKGLHKLCGEVHLWDYFTFDLSKIENFKPWSADHFEGKRLQFVVIEKSSGKFLGSSGFGNYSKRDKRVEIGWTWFGTVSHGKGINRRAKRLMLAYAFDKLFLLRVEFKTDVLNLFARQALKRIGAIEEGVLRSHTLLHHGRRRDSIFYSYLPEDWAKVR